MPTLTEDKKESIWRTYDKTKSLSGTAKIEDVDARTVRKIVSGKKAKLTVMDRSDSPVAKATKSAGNRIVDPERKVQLKAYKWFESDRSNFQVSQELKLSSSEVLQYRKEYNDMKKDDYDEGLELRKKYKIRIEGIIQQSQTELSQCEAVLSRRKAELSQCETELQGAKSNLDNMQTKVHLLNHDTTNLDETSQRLQQSVQQLTESEKKYTQSIKAAEQRCLDLEKKAKKIEVGGFTPMEAFPDPLLYSRMREFYRSNMFMKLIPEPATTGALTAIARHPNRSKICKAILEAVVEKTKPTDLLSPNPVYINTEDFKTLVIHMAEEASYAGRLFTYSLEGGNYLPILIPEVFQELLHIPRNDA